MKNKLPVLLAVVALALVAVCVYQARRMTERKSQLVSLRSETERQAQQLEELNASKEHLNRQRAELLQQATDQASQLSQQKLATAQTTALAPGQPGVPGKQEADAAGFGKLISKMMEDPDTKKLILEQQRMMMDMLYSPLTKQLGMTAEESAKFKELLAANAMKGAEKATSLFGGNGAATNRSEMLTTFAAETRASEDKIKELLGDSRYAQYLQFQQTAGERMQWSLFKQQGGAGDTTFTEQQTEQLFGFMREEKQVLAAAGQPIAGTGNDPATLQAMMSEDQTDTLLQGQQDVSARVYERAKGVLSPEQLNAFGKFQTNQLQLMRMGMTMARKLIPSDSH